jgi:hypothetical protein
MRGRRLLLLAPLLLVGAACRSGGDTNTATSVPPTSDAPTTAETETTSPTTTDPATTAPGSIAPASTAPGSTTEADAETVTAYFDDLGLSLTVEETACLTGSLDATTLASLADAVANGAEAGETTRLAVLRGIAICEPVSYAETQIEAIVSLASTSEEDAACIVAANNALLRDDDAVLALAAGDLSPAEWPAAERDKLRATLVTCVPGDVADRLLEG